MRYYRLYRVAAFHAFLLRRTTFASSGKIHRPPTRFDRQKIILYNREGGDKAMGTQKRKGTPPPRYDEAFKAGAIQLVTEQGHPSREVAQELGICIDTLRNWLKSSGVQAGQTDRRNCPLPYLMYSKTR
jgi:hypothetical protein